LPWRYRIRIQTVSLSFKPVPSDVGMETGMLAVEILLMSQEYLFSW
jgi:hypothetical protein